MNHDVAVTSGWKDDDSALDAALAELESALESSHPERAREVLDRYPHWAIELQSYLGNRDAIDGIAAPLRQAAHGVLEPPQIDGYRILGLYDEGGMGFIYRAHYERLDQVVALKVMRRDRPVSEKDILRLQTEARYARDLAHRNIVRVHDIGEHDGLPYYSMELVNGVSLKEHLEKEGAYRSRAVTNESRDASKLLMELAEAMASAHEKGIIHRDLKPGNILIDHNGHPRIIDFGLSKREGDSDSVEPGSFVGTPFYCSPEQANYEGHRAGPAADVYSLGAILYEILTGQPPLQGANYEETLEKVREQEPVTPLAHNRDIDLSLETICMRCLQKKPEQRYPNAHELLADIQRYRENRPLLSSKVGNSFWDWLISRGIDEKISKIGRSLLRFQALYTACILVMQLLLVANWGEPLAWLLTFGSLTLLFTLLRTDDSVGLLPSNYAERLLWSIWMATVFAHLMLAIAMRVSYGYVEGFHQTFAVMPFITGMAYFITGGSFWRKNVMWGMAWMVLGVVTEAFVPSPWSPTAYILFSCACTSHLVIEQLRLERQRYPTAKAPSVTQVEDVHS